MNVISTKTERKEDGEKAGSIKTKAPLTERIMKKAATTALVVGIALGSTACNLICPFDVSQLRSSEQDGDVTDSDVDAGHDTDVVDSDVRDSDIVDGDTSDAEVLDGDITDSDLDVADSDVVDSDVEEDADTDVADGDITDSDVLDGDVSDGDLADSDVEEDAGPTACPGVSNGSIVSESVDVGDSVTVGGYSLTYVGQVAGTDDIYIDVHCAATGDEVEMGIVVPLYGNETASAPLDGKNIEITNHSSSDARTRISATVSDS
ncbi:hypothetical protein KKE92_03065 [Candidatus Micrarchaeota archaeon]|nr:hypothetical protein [Candidatus Micrarchaeota archaeon]MBU1681702.1 hypothetical protein [Candidatus Micrarchaeota archaeon]